MTQERRPHRRGFLRRHRAFTSFVAVGLVVLLAFGAWVAYLLVQVGDVPRFDLDVDGEERPAAVEGKGVNILLAGADNENAAGSLAEALEQSPDDWDPGVFRSDTLMVLHVDADRKHAQVISIPRDTYLEVPGHGKTKVNAAFSFGGPSLMVATIEKYTGIRIDHVAMVDLDGFANISDAVGGVRIYIPQTVTDSARGITWQQGWQTVKGEQALSYVRQRKGLPGGDFDRVQRQQNFLRALLDKVASTGTLGNPIKVTRLVSDLSGYLNLDSGFSTGEVRDLAIGGRGLRPADIAFATIPITGTPTIDGASVVTADDALVRTMFKAIADDDWAGFAAQHDVTLLPDQTSVD